MEQHIHLEAIAIAKNYKRCEIELIEILEKVDRLKIYYKYGHGSLFKYCTDCLELSPEVTSIFINVARKIREVPALKEEIKSGNITVSKARRITAVLNPQNQKQWLDLAKSASKRILEKEVAAHSPREAVRERLDYVHESNEVREKIKLMTLDGNQRQVRVQLQAGISEKLMLKLRRVQDLLSSKKRKVASLEDALDAMADLFIERHDPMEKAKRQKIRGKLQEGNNDQIGVAQNNKEQSDIQSHSGGKKLSCPGTIAGKAPGATPGKTPVKRQPLTANARHLITLKYQGQCAFENHGQRCEERRFLEVHHKKPVAQGGTNNLENLTLFCSGHHKAHHFD